VSGTTLLTQRAADFTTVKMYDASGKFLGGALVFVDQGHSWVAAMNSESDTDTRGRTGSAKALSAPAGAAGRTQRLAMAAAAADDTCYGIAKDLTTAPAEWASEAGDRIDDASGLLTGAGKPGLPNMVKRAAQFLSHILGDASSLCGDTPLATATRDAARESALGALDTILDSDAKTLLESYSTAQQLTDAIAAGAARVSQALSSGARTVTTASGSLSTPTLTGSTTSAAASTEAQKTYFAFVNCMQGGTATPVVQYDANGKTISFRYSSSTPNTCASRVQFAYCVSSGPNPAALPACTPYLREEFNAGANWVRLGRETVNDTVVISEGARLSQCPMTLDTKPVFIDTTKTQNGCYYYK